MSDVLAEVWYRMATVSEDPDMKRVYLHRAHERAPERVNQFVSDRVLEHLPKLLFYRNYSLITEYIEWLIEVQGWKGTLLSLREILEGTGGIEGKTRDALFHVLDLSPVIGLDIDPLKAFVRLRGGSLQKVRSGAFKSARKLLLRQIENRNTFFLNIDELQGTGLEDMGQSITETRKNEVLDLPSEPTLREVFSTYHGFLTFATYSEHVWGNTVSEGKAKFKKLAKAMGKQITWKGRHRLLPLRNTIWTNVSPAMHQLLLDLLRVSLNRGAERAALDLANSGESRVMQVLNQMQARGHLERNVRSYVEDTLRKIGESCEREAHHDFWIELARNMSGKKERQRRNM